MMVIAGMLASASYFGHATPRVLLFLSVLQGITVAFNAPAWQVLTPRLVPRHELTEAIALNGLQFNLARVVGPALGGVLMAAYSPTVLFAINTISFVGVLAGISTTPDAPAPTHNGASPLKRTAEACAFVFRGRGPRAIFLALVTFAVLAAPLMRMLPLYASDVYRRGDPLYDLILQYTSPAGAGEFIFGLLLAVMGAGAFTGAILIRRVPAWYPKHHFIPLSIFGAGLTITAFSAVHGLTLACPLLFIAGVFWLWAFNSALAAMQLLVPDAMRGRVMAVCYTPVFGAMPLGALVAGGIGDLAAPRIGPVAGMQAGVGLLGALLAAAGLVMLIWRTPEIDGLIPGDPGFERRPGLLSGLTARAHRPARAPRPPAERPAPQATPRRSAPAAAPRSAPPPSRSACPSPRAGPSGS
jgi:MFS family permease